MNNFLGKVRESASGRLEEEYSLGYDEAANICIGVLSKTIDSLMNKINSGRLLSDHEQFLLASVSQMRSEADTALREYRRSAIPD